MLGKGEELGIAQWPNPPQFLIPGAGQYHTMFMLVLRCSGSTVIPSDTPGPRLVDCGQRGRGIIDGQ
jgi:hypothetical protein